MSINPLVIPIVAILVPIVIVPAALVMKYLKQVRELEHLERMRALELGRRLSDAEDWSPTNIGLAIGGGVPLGVFFCAWMATQSTKSEEILFIVWFAAMMVGSIAVVSGAKIVRANSNANVTGYPTEENHFVKAEFADADAFDVVSRRG